MPITKRSEDISKGSSKSSRETLQESILNASKQLDQAYMAAGYADRSEIKEPLKRAQEIIQEIIKTLGLFV